MWADTLLCSTAGLTKVKHSTKNPAISKWGGDTYLALMSNRITHMQLVRENT